MAAAVEGALVGRGVDAERAARDHRVASRRRAAAQGVGALEDRARCGARADQRHRARALGQRALPVQHRRPRERDEPARISRVAWCHREPAADHAHRLPGHCLRIKTLSPTPISSMARVTRPIDMVSPTWTSTTLPSERAG